MNYINILLPIGGFSTSLLLALVLNSIFKKNPTFSKKDFFTSSIFILIFSIYILYHNLGFSSFNISTIAFNKYFIIITSIITIALLFFKFYIFAIAVILTNIFYLLQIYENNSIVFYTVDIFSIPLSIIVIKRYICSRKKN